MASMIDLGGSIVGGCSGIGHLKVENRIDMDDEVVLGDDGLGRAQYRVVINGLEKGQILDRQTCGGTV
jgi:hypothetical protein